MPATVVAKEVMDANTVTTIINNLNSLYSGAMGQVITYTAIMIGIVGILIPALSVIYQWRSLKSEKKSLEKDIHDDIENAKLSIRNDIVAEINKLIALEEKALTSRMEEKFKVLDKKLECAKANSFHIQGNEQIKTGFHALAASDLCIATESYLRGEDEVNGQRTLRILLEKCLPKIDKTQYEEFDIE